MSGERDALGALSPSMRNLQGWAVLEGRSDPLLERTSPDSSRFQGSPRECFDGQSLGWDSGAVCQPKICLPKTCQQNKKGKRVEKGPPACPVFEKPVSTARHFQLIQFFESDCSVPRYSSIFFGSATSHE